MKQPALAPADVAPVAPLQSTTSVGRPTAAGKFLYVGEEKFYVRGVTYGPFAERWPGDDGYDPVGAERDFAEMAANGINAVRTYALAPRWLLDAADRHGLRVMVGLPWEQHVAFLQERGRARSIEQRVRAAARQLAGHPAVLAYAVGNEIPAPVVRWHGRQPVERFLARLTDIVRAEDPAALVTYVNYPSTEYLYLPFVDFLCFNIYLESPERFSAYLARLQHVAGDRPLVVGELGLDSRRHGAETQAGAIAWQLRAAFEGGSAGAFVFSWTDEWSRGGHEIHDWDFGLTTRRRQEKPSLAAVREAYAEVPFAMHKGWPRISVVVCSYNGAKTIRDCLEGLSRLEYPDFEVLVVDDGSTDDTAAIASRYPFRLIRTGNQGLGAARNVGLAAATGEIVAYTDDDARPDPLWLVYLAHTFMTTGHAAVGGPNLAPPGDGRIAECVANAPGGPVHVLRSDTEAEHVPGCNMAVRKDRLAAVGGFDPRFRVAGDDVDVCWRLQERGWSLGFSPAALVWHHARNSVRRFWRQQLGYGKAEALLEDKWPEKYNTVGHVTWGGRLYRSGLLQAPRWRQRIYQGVWGTAPFQSLDRRDVGLLSSLPLMPEWYLLLAALAGLSGLGALWGPLLAALPLLALATGASLVQAALGASRSSFMGRRRSRRVWPALWLLTAFLHLLQPLARLTGRLRHGLTPWRGRGAARRALPFARTSADWSERWQAAEARLRAAEATLLARRFVVVRGGEYDSWDLHVRGGILGGARIRVLAEEHGAGHQLVRFRAWPWAAPAGVALAVTFATLSILAAASSAPAAAVVLAVIALVLSLRIALDCGTGMAGALLGRTGR